MESEGDKATSKPALAVKPVRAAVDARAVRPNRCLLERGPRGVPPRFVPSRSPCSFVRRGSLQGALQFALLGARGGERCYSLAFASAEPSFPCILCPRLELSLEPKPLANELCGDVSRRPGCEPTSRPLFMSALDEPSRESFRPLTPHVVTRHQRVGSCSDRQLPPRAFSRRTRSDFTE